MGVFEAIGADTHEEVAFGHDPVSGLRTIIAIHSTALGPALGGTRFFPYPSEQEALEDVLRLAKGMTYKAAVAGLDLGGGKAVIIGDPATLKSERLLRAYGQTIESLGGRYITAEDIGTTADDMAIIARETRWVTGLAEELGGSGDPSPATARGVLNAMRAVAEHLWDTDDLAGRVVAVQGAGKVGANLVARLTKAGAVVVLADIDTVALDRVAVEHGARIVAPDEIYDVECDLFSPCALGAVLDESTIPRLSCRAVVGSANNQLATDHDATRLAARDILYVPDFVANAGGIVAIAAGIEGYDFHRAAVAIDRIRNTVTEVLATAAAEGVDPHQAAVALAERRLAAIGTLPRPRPAPSI